jgi:TRAP transporter 4TM/12TM fusion protein
MPPIMGAAAFLMADIIGVPYSDILKRAVFPAVLYFTGIFIAVHLEAKKHGLTGIPAEKLPKFSKLLKKIYLLAPLVLLVVWVSKNMMTMQRAAAYSIVVAIAVGIVDGFVSGNRFTLKKFFESLEAGGRGTITVVAACGVAGIISGTITMTGLANEMINAIVAVAGNKLFIALFLTMLCCIVLGMGVPTTATYCIMAATCAPILTRMGVPILAAHFFVFYFGIVADITPPVALAAYAGSAIAKSNPMRTAVAATKMAVGAFLIPYIFCFNPEMLLIDTEFSGVIMIYITALLGIVGVASALEGFLLTDMLIIERLLFTAGGIMLIFPGTLTDGLGLALIAAGVVMQFIRKKGRATVGSV